MRGTRDIESRTAICSDTSPSNAVITVIVAVLHAPANKPIDSKLATAGAALDESTIGEHESVAKITGSAEAAAATVTAVATTTGFRYIR